ncbi:hypothetical protein LIER_17983 [Lithospermum erythrorhizon]|uniref:Reverse transcriptase domain-containing protein n=1 Tax=Lithospermum erythrorhizon TaxID=34254 RepID=A0AAV3QFK0_LITER
MSEIRPISLCNIVAKIVSKVLTNRLWPVLMKINSETQSAFLTGRIISDNILIAHEVLHHMKHSKLVNNNSMALKLDMSKAYDRVELPFLEAIMIRLGFCRVFVDWIMCLVSTVSYSFLVNGAPNGFIRPKRGIRQGDPFRDSPSISHILFADHTMIFCKAGIEEGADVRRILGEYEEVGDQGKYLGLPSQIERSKKEAFSYITKRVEERTKGWRGRLLSQAGKEVLIKTVTIAIPNYVMNCFLLPQGIIDNLNSFMEKFFSASSDTDKGVHWKSWEVSCVDKNEGGLGFKDLQYMNLTLLTKQGWRIANGEVSLLYKVLKGRYFKMTPFLRAKLRSNPSFGWRSILEGEEYIRRKKGAFDGNSLASWEWKEH